MITSASANRTISSDHQERRRLRLDRVALAAPPPAAPAPAAPGPARAGGARVSRAWAGRAVAGLGGTWAGGAGGLTAGVAGLSRGVTARRRSHCPGAPWYLRLCAHGPVAVVARQFGAWGACAGTLAHTPVVVH